jgi:hypothetical protein
MISTIVTPSLNTMQLFALIAVILFIVGGVIAVLERSIYTVLICSGLVFLSLAALFSGGL